MDEKEAKEIRNIAENIEVDLREGNISLVLDSYNDIFSDFDPRSYSEKALSDDFLSECKRAARDKESGVELRFFVPKTKRKLGEEKEIKKRLKEHFKKHFNLLEKEKKEVIKRGAYFIILGVIVMFLATFVLFKYEKTILTSFLIIFLEPASWFLFWEGLDMVIFESKKTRHELSFYEKMSRCSIKFMSY